MRVSVAAARHRDAAADALAGGVWSAALHHAAEATWLQRTEAGDDLLLLARLLNTPA
jgi:hypothetical protein